MGRALVIVDIQRDYFPGGAHPLEAPDAAVRAAKRLLESFRASGETVVHVRHVWDEAEATFMRPGTSGVEIHPEVAPEDGELVIAKAFPNSFRETVLEEELRARGVEAVVVCGMMTSMCVDATVRATVACDACATCDLEFDGRSVAAADVQSAFLAALADGYARVALTSEITSQRD
jgi:nicotinamidase-related amidase